MHLAANSVSDILSDDTYAVRVGARFNGGPDVTEPLPSNSLLDSGPKGLLSHVKEELDLLGDISDGHRERCVTMPPLIDRTRIDTDDVAIFEDVVARDSVDDRRVR